MNYIESISNYRPPERFNLSLPVSVFGYDRHEGKWHEITRTLGLSRAGVTLRLRRAMAVGTVLHLTLPLPVELRQYAHSDKTYMVYAIVRQVEPHADGASTVAVDFLGERPPVGYLSRPWATFK